MGTLSCILDFAYYEIAHGNRTKRWHIDISSAQLIHALRALAHHVVDSINDRPNHVWDFWDM